MTSCSLIGGYQDFGGLLKMETTGSSKMLVTIYKTTRHHYLEDHSPKFVQGFGFDPWHYPMQAGTGIFCQLFHVPSWLDAKRNAIQ
jgi:hypothetical protein